MYERILVPIDGSEGAERAIEQALEVADSDATLYGLHVVDVRRYGEPALSTEELVTDEAEDAGHRLLEAFADRATSEGFDVTTRCVHGVPHEEILTHADAFDVDLIVLGYEGVDHRRHIGSVTKEILEISQRPVRTT